MARCARCYLCGLGLAITMCLPACVTDLVFYCGEGQQARRCAPAAGVGWCCWLDGRLGNYTHTAEEDPTAGREPNRGRLTDDRALKALNMALGGTIERERDERQRHQAQDKGLEEQRLRGSHSKTGGRYRPRPSPRALAPPFDHEGSRESRLPPPWL